MRVKCTHCEFVGSVTIGPSLYYYELPDGQQLPLFHRQAWCAECATIVNAEELPDVAEIQGLLEGAIADEAAGGAAESQPERIKLLQGALQWRLLRESPPRCLVCGTYRIESLKPLVGSSAARHPQCGGELQFEIGAYVTLGDTGGKCSPEGVRLELPSVFRRR
jgi:hypothetical protein